MELIVDDAIVRLTPVKRVSLVRLSNMETMSPGKAGRSSG